MTQVNCALDQNVLIELGLRFGWIKPVPMGVKTPKGDTWRLYGKILGRRYTEVRKGRISTNEFIAQWSLCKTAEERAAAFGGVLQEVEEGQREWSTPFSVMVKYRDRMYPGRNGTQWYSWEYSPRLGAWKFGPVGTNPVSDMFLRDVMDIHKWTARTEEQAKELNKSYREKFGID